MDFEMLNGAGGTSQLNFFNDCEDAFSIIVVEVLFNVRLICI